MTIRVQAQPFDPGTELNALHAANLGIGAVVTFVGYVRDFNEGREVGGMFLEHFPGMTEKALAKIAAEVNASVENIGARRLYTVLERVFEELSFTAPDRGGEEVVVNAEFVDKNLGELMASPDISRYVL